MAEDQNNEIETPSEEDTEEDTEEAESETTESEVVCSVCKEIVIPHVISTDRGKRYRCPSCGKFMRPLSLDKAYDYGEEEDEREQEEYRPPEVEMTDRARELMEEKLPRVYGLPKKKEATTIRAILDTVTFDTLRDPIILHQHVKSFAPGVNEKHLETIISSIYSTLRDEGYIQGDNAYVPAYKSYGRVSGERGGRYKGIRQQLGIRVDEEEERRSRKRGGDMTIVVDGQEIRTDLDGYRAWKRFEAEQKREQREAREHEIRMKKLEAEVLKLSKGGSQPGQEMVEVPYKGNIIKVPIYMAHLYLEDDDDKEEKLEEIRSKAEAEREKRFESEMARVVDLLEREMGKPGFFEQMQQYQQAGQMLGMSPTGKTTIDVIDSGFKGLDTRVGQLLNQVGPGKEFNPQVTRTPSERQQKAEEIMGSLEGSEEMLQAENELLESAAKVAREESD